MQTPRTKRGKTKAFRVTEPMGVNDRLIPEAMSWPRVYVDGGAEGNGRTLCRASWAYQIGDDAEPVAGMVTGPPTPTNNRAEFLAIINAIRALMAMTPSPPAVLFVTDSDYCKQSSTTWRHGWKRNGWQRSGGALANADLIKELDGLIARAGFRIAFVHVRSHCPKPSDPLLLSFWTGNDSVDRAAGALIEEKSKSATRTPKSSSRPSKRRSVIPAAAPVPAPSSRPVPVAVASASARVSKPKPKPTRSASAIRKIPTLAKTTAQTPKPPDLGSKLRRMMKRQLLE